jgi:hypothetical protein
VICAADSKLGPVHGNRLEVTLYWVRRTCTQVVRWLHAVLCELIPCGVPKAITAARAPPGSP